MDKLDYLEKELSRLLAWIQAADSRASIILPIDTAMLGLMAALLPKYICISNQMLAFPILAMLLLLFSITCLVFSSFPRTDGPKNSIIFFNGIAKRNINEYESSVLNLTINEYESDLIQQCHINAEIADVKYQWVKRSMAGLFLATPFWIISIYLLYGLK